MTTAYIIVGAIVLILIVFIVYNYKKMNNQPNVADHENIKTLNKGNFKTVIRSGLVLVDFWAPWCGPCKVMAPILNDMAGTEDINFSIGKVNVDNQQELAQKFKIRSIPTMVMFRNGKEVKRFSGVKTKTFLMKEINNYLNK